MSRGLETQHTGRPGPFSQPGYLEDAEIVSTMISTYKACVEPWENHLGGKQVVWSEMQEGTAETTGQSHLTQPRERQLVVGFAQFSSSCDRI